VSVRVPRGGIRLVAAAAITVAMLSVVFTSSALAAASTIGVAPGSDAAKLLSTIQLQAGQVLAKYSVDGTEIDVAASPGVTLSVTSQGDGQLAYTVSPPSGSEIAQPGAAGVDAAATSGNAIALASVEQGAAPASTTAATTASATPFNTACVYVPGSYAYGQGGGCLIQTWLHTGSGNCGCWYSENQISANAEGTGGELVKADNYYCYCNGDNYTRQGAGDPDASVVDGTNSSETKTESETVNFGSYGSVGLSESETLSGNSQTNPFYPNTESNAAFGVQWVTWWNGGTPLGATYNFYESLNSSAVVNPGVGSPGSAQMHGDIYTGPGGEYNE
jgi:hypothetical protein